MIRIRRVLLALIALLLAALAYEKVSDLRAAHTAPARETRPVPAPVVATLAQQETCARAAREEFHEWSHNQPTADYQNHFDPITGKCFMVVSYTTLTNPVSDNRILVDAMEHRVVGQYRAWYSKDQPTDPGVRVSRCYVDRIGSEDHQKCADNLAWREMAKVYLGAMPD